MKINNAWTSKRIREFKEAYQIMNCRELAKQFNISYDHCRHLLSKFKITKDDYGWTKEDDRLIVGLEIERVPKKEIAKKMDRSVNSLYQHLTHLKKSGVYYTIFAEYVTQKQKVSNATDCKS